MNKIGINTLRVDNKRYDFIDKDVMCRFIALNYNYLLKRHVTLEYSLQGLRYEEYIEEPHTVDINELNTYKKMASL